MRLLVEDALRLDPDNADAKTFLAAANRDAAPATPVSSTVSVAAPEPTSFANGRYTVTRFLGEGGKKKVYLARDSRLDREVAFALIKNGRLDQASRELGASLRSQ